MSLQERYVNPLTDFGFKKLFGSEPNKELLIDFLNQVIPDYQIEDLSYTSTEYLGQGQLDRKAIFDLHCIGTKGERFIVEMQKAKQNYFKDRSVFYASFPIQDQAKKGDWNYQLQAIFSIGILDFVFEESTPTQLIHTVMLKNQYCTVFYDKLKFIYIELPKFKKQEPELETHLDKWLYVFRHLSRLQERPYALQERIFSRLFEAAEIAKFSKQEREAYEESLKYYRDLKNVVDTSKEEGYFEGIAAGIEQGIVQIARKMKASGYPIEQIVAVTGLPKEYLENLEG